MGKCAVPNVFVRQYGLNKNNHRIFLEKSGQTCVFFKTKPRLIARLDVALNKCIMDIHLLVNLFSDLRWKLKYVVIVA